MRKKLAVINKILGDKLRIGQVVFAILFTCILGGIFVKPVNIQTDILSIVFDNTTQDAKQIAISNLSRKMSSRLNVLFEAENFTDAKNTADVFYKNLDKTDIKSINFAFDAKQINDFIETLKPYNFQLLDEKTRGLIQNNKFKTIVRNSLYKLYVTPSNILSFTKDPFMLFSDYIKTLQVSPNNFSLKNNVLTAKHKGKHYVLMSLELDENISFSPSKLSVFMERFLKYSEINSNDKVKVHVSGVPIHTYYSSSKTIKQINIISVLSVLFIIAISYMIFGTVKYILPTLLTIAIAFIGAFGIISLIFPSIHILTLVFGTTLIGISVDYSLHFFASRKNNVSDRVTLKYISKSLTSGLITTVLGFAVLLFAKLSLLNQIAVFSISGLVIVYSFIMLFYPFLCGKLAVREIKPAFLKINKPFDKVNIWVKRFLIFGLVAVSLFSVFRVEFNDDIRALYKPPTALLKAEKLFAEVSNGEKNTAFFIIKHNDLQSNLKIQEKLIEKIKDLQVKYPSISYIATTQILPSEKRQHENWHAIKKIYNNKLNEYLKVIGLDEKKAEIINKNLKNSEDKFLKLEHIRTPEFSFITDLIFKTKNAYFSTVMINHNIKNNEILQKLANDIPNVSYLNIPEEISNKMAGYRVECFALFAGVFVILCVFLTKRYSLKSACLILLPSIMSILLTITLLDYLNINMNFFHILAMFLLIGFSLDYSIFIFSKHKEALIAILFSCLTSVFSFGLLALTSFEITKSLGLVLSFGLFVSFVFSLLILSNKTEQ